jgi:hypothetical protein
LRWRFSMILCDFLDYRFVDESFAILIQSSFNASERHERSDGNLVFEKKFDRRWLIQPGMKLDLVVDRFDAAV